MKYRKPPVDAIRLGTKNAIPLVAVSALTSLAALPLATSALLAPGFGWVAGMWTTCLLWGIVLVGGFAQCVAVAERQVHTGTAALWAGIRRGWLGGLIIGVATFGLCLSAIGLVVLPYGGLRGTSLSLIAAYLVVGWVLLLAFSLPSYVRDDDRDLRGAFASGFDRILRAPGAAVWFLLQSIGWTILSVVTLVTPFLLLPGFLMLLAVTITDAAVKADAESEQASRTTD